MMYKKYSEDKDAYLLKFRNFILTIGGVDFNKSMKILDLKIRYNDDKLKYDHTFLQQLMECYQEYVKMVEVNHFGVKKTKKLK